MKNITLIIAFVFVAVAAYAEPPIVIQKQLVIQGGGRVIIRGGGRVVIGPGGVVRGAAINLRPVMAEEEEPVPDDEQGRRVLSNVEVDADVEADLESAKKLEEKGDWGKAIELYQKILSEKGKSLVTIQEGVFASARKAVEERLRAMPEQAQALYSNTYALEAKKLYERACSERDIKTAEQAARSFARTPHGLPALYLLGTMQMETGDAAGALDSFGKYLAASPDIAEAERRQLAVKMAAAAALISDAAALEGAIKLFGDKGEAVDAGDKKVSTAAELRALYGAKIVAASKIELPSNVNFIKWQASVNSAPNRTTPTYQQMPYLTYGCQGVVLGGDVIVNSVEGLRRFSIETGRPIWSKPRSGTMSQRYYPIFHEAFFCGMNDSRAGVVAAGNLTRIEGFDPNTGNSAWMIRPQNNNQNFRGGPPRQDNYAYLLVRGNTLYLGKTGADNEIFAYDMRTGTQRWAAGLGTFTDFQNRQSFGTRFVISGNKLLFWAEGIIGCASAINGEVDWISQYASDEIGHDPQYHRYQTTLAATSELLFVAPIDRGEITARRVSDGKIIWKKIARQTRSIMGYLEGKDGKPGRLFIETEANTISCLNELNGETIWTFPLPDAYMGGACILTNETFVFATAKGLYTLDPSNGEMKDFLALPNTQPGRIDVIPAQDSYVLIGGGYVRVVASCERTLAAIDATLNEWAPDPYLKIIKARAFKEQGNIHKATATYEEAFELLKDKPAEPTINRNELVELYHALYQKENREGRKKEGFDWMIKAIRASKGAPYMCRLGVLSQEPEKRPHAIKLLTGDVIRGKIGAIEETAVVVNDGAKVWRLDIKGVRSVSFTPAVSDAPGTEESILFTNGDHIVCKIEAGGPDGLIASTKFGKLDVKYADISSVEFARGNEQKFKINARIKLTNGDVLSAAISGFDGINVTANVPFCGDIVLPMSEIYSIASTSTVLSASTPQQPFPVPPGNEPPPMVDPQLIEQQVIIE